MEDPIAQFDVDTAIANLGREALRLGATPSLGCDPNDLYRLSFQHVLLHSVQHQVASFDPCQADAKPAYQPAERCLKRPCRLGAVCFALHELLQYKRELQSPLAQAIIATMNTAHKLWPLFREQILTFAPIVRELVQSNKELHEWEEKFGAPGSLHNHRLMCIVPRDILKHCVQALEQMKTLDDELPAQIEAAELAQIPFGNRRALLLTAVAQHLRWGKLSHPEIMRLVPDGLNDDKGERVRQRARAANARTLLPAM